MRATDTVLDFIYNTRLSDIPEDVQHLGKRAILDTLGVSIAGSTDNCIQILLQTLEGHQGDSNASLIGISQRTDTLSAAMINGTMAHALDFDDVNDSFMGHPSAPILPAVIALGEKLGVSGASLLEAFLIGFEIECKLGSAIGKSHYAHGWHATATLGTIGAAAASAKLMGLDRDTTGMSLGIAGSLSSGIRVNFGTMTKPLHVGEAARNGVLASLLASKGFTATSNIFDHPIDFCNVFSQGEVDKSFLTESLGAPWAILSPGIVVKKYPCCNNTHRTIDATLGLVNDHSPQPNDISKIVVTMPPGEEIPLIYSKATTGLEGKFSMQFCVASAIVDGQVHLDTFEQHRVERANVQEMSGKVTLVTDENQEPVVVNAGGHINVAITMKDGQTLVRRTEKATGTPTYPLSDKHLQDKFRDCARAILDANEIENTISRVYGLENISFVSELIRPLCFPSMANLPT